MISIKGLEKAAVLAALYNVSYPRRAGFDRYDPTPMTVESAREMIVLGDDIRQVFGTGSHPGRIFFDWLKGRPLKADLSEDEFDPTEYNHYVGESAAEKAITALITTGDVNPPESREAHRIGMRRAPR